MTESVLNLEHIWVRYHPSRSEEIVAVENASLAVQENEFVALVGPSGCGKSTLLRVAAGLETPTGGRVRVDGLETWQPGADRGMVFQTYTLFPWLTVRQNIRFALKKTPCRKPKRTNASSALSG